MDQATLDLNAIRGSCRELVKLQGGYERAARLLEISVGSLHSYCRPGEARFLTLPEIHLLQSDVGADPVSKLMSDLALRHAAPHESMGPHCRLKQVWERARELEVSLLDGHRSRGLKAIDDLMIVLHRARCDFLGDCGQQSGRDGT